MIINFLINTKLGQLLHFKNNEGEYFHMNPYMKRHKILSTIPEVHHLFVALPDTYVHNFVRSTFLKIAYKIVPLKHNILYQNNNNNSIETEIYTAKYLKFNNDSKTESKSNPERLSENKSFVFKQNSLGCVKKDISPDTSEKYSLFESNLNSNIILENKLKSSIESSHVKQNKTISEINPQFRQKNILSKIKNLISKQTNKNMLKNIFDINRKKMIVNEDVNEQLFNNLKRKHPRRIRRFVKSRKKSGAKQLLKILLRECHKVRMSLIKARIDYIARNEVNHCYKTVSSSIVTTIVPYQQKDGFSRETNCYESEEDQEDTFFGLEDNLASICENETEKESLTSISLYITASCKTSAEISLSPHTIQEKELRNFEVKPIFISVYEKFFPKIHILFSTTDQLSENEESNNQCSIKSQSNNSNTTNSKLNTHKYFRHAQQLLSNNSSQMESIVYGNVGDPTLQPKAPQIKPFTRGVLTETGEDISFLRNKLNSNLNQQNDPYSDNESCSLPFDRLLDKDLNREETSMIMTHIKNRNLSQGPLTEFRERKQRERIENQANDYKNMSSNFSKLKVEYNQFENSKPRVMNSPERVKNIQFNNSHKKVIEKLVSTSEKSAKIRNENSQSLNESISSDSCNNIGSNSNASIIQDLKTNLKKVSFNENVPNTHVTQNNVKSPYLEDPNLYSIQNNGKNPYSEDQNNCSMQKKNKNLYQENTNMHSIQNNFKNPYPEDVNLYSVQTNFKNPYSEDPNMYLIHNNVKNSYPEKTDYNKVNYLEKEVQGISMMLNNIVRRMNNLELNFQEFSSLFIKIHKETIDFQKNMSQCCNCRR